jgi:protein-disulfide isomerase
LSPSVRGYRIPPMTKRIFTWAGFIIIIGLIVWGMVVAQKNKGDSPVSGGLPTEVSEADWIHGSSSAAITIVEYSDFQCPACYAYHPMVDRLVHESDGKVRLVYRHFPLPQHRHALIASISTEAAGKQGKFWEMHHKIFDTQKEWETADNAREIFVKYAEQLELDMEKFLKDLEDTSIEEKIVEQYRTAARAGVNSTPTFFVNGKRIENPNSYEAFKDIIYGTSTDAQNNLLNQLI